MLGKDAKERGGKSEVLFSGRKSRRRGSELRARVKSLVVGLPECRKLLRSEKLLMNGRTL